MPPLDTNWFLCTCNGACGVRAEAIAKHVLPGGRFTAYSAGSQPRGAVNPAALELLARAGIPTADLRSKSWEEFADEDAPRLAFIITVCDQAAGETCPYWPGKRTDEHTSELQSLMSISYAVCCLKKNMQTTIARVNY